jgi:hemolysin activation/secretion protein
MIRLGASSRPHSPFRVRAVLALFLWSVLWAPAIAWAQGLPSGAVSPNVTAPNTAVPAVPPGLPGSVSPIAPLLPPRLPQVTPGLPSAPPPPAATGTGTVAIGDVSVAGVTAYPPATFARLTEGLTGAAVPQAKIEAAREAIVARYRADGYVYTAVNAIVSDGHLRLLVTEGRITDVKLDGDIGPAGTQVLRFLNHLTETQPINVASLERWLLLASDVPGVTVRSVLNPTDTPGELVLIAQVSRKPVSGLLSADNRAFRQTGPEEGLAVVDFNSFTEFGERTELSFYRTFNGTQIFGQASSEVFVGGSGLKLRLYAGAGDATPSGSLRAIGYDGTTTVFGAQASYPIIRARAETLNATLVFDALESEITTTTGQGGSRARASFDSLRVLRGGGDYALLDTVLGPSMPATNGVILRVSQGLPALGASGNRSPDAPRTNERTDFTKVNGQISRNQTLFGFADSTVAAQATLLGQGTGNVLPPEEKFYLGGPHFNRGFYYGQVTGDNALVASAELQYNVPLPSPPSWGLDLSAQFYAFYDWGETWENQKTDLNHILRSAGGGARLYLTQYLEVDLEGVARITQFPNGRGAGVSPLPGAAFYWQVLARF